MGAGRRLVAGLIGSAWIVLSACGARTGLDTAGPPLDAGAAMPEKDGSSGPPPDAGGDASRDAHADAPVDAPSDVSSDGAAFVAGCSDGTREGFVDVAAYPTIAGCSGGWSIPGVMAADPGTAPACPGLSTYDTVHPACGRAAGNDSSNPTGSGCNVADLCAAGWHVCAGAADVRSQAPAGCADATPQGDATLFFASRQSSNGCNDCATGTDTGPSCNSAACVTGCAETADTSNDVFGCGNLGNPAGLVDCGPLDEASNNLCSSLGFNWSCQDDGSGLCEAYAIVHAGPEYGGVLCCGD
jgi:hypothetical protein